MTEGWLHVEDLPAGEQVYPVARAGNLHDPLMAVPRAEHVAAPSHVLAMPKPLAGTHRQARDGGSQPQPSPVHAAANAPEA